MPSLFYVTDGIDKVDFLAIGSGFAHKDYRPGYPSPKGGGVWIDPPLVDGRRLAIRSINNVTDTIELTVLGASMDEISSHVEGLLDMLDQGMRYWTSPQVPQIGGSTPAPKPVYLVVRGSYQSSTRYAIIYDYRFSSDANPLAPPYGDNNPVVNLVTLTIERGLWLEGEPGEGIPIALSIVNVYSSITADLTLTPLAQNDDAAILHGSAYIGLADTSARVGVYSGNADFAIRFPNVTIPAGQEIIFAELSCTGATAQISLNEYRIYGEDINNSPQFSTYANYVGRARTTNFCSGFATLSFPGGTIIYGYNARGMPGVIQEIIDIPGWASGNALSLFMQNIGIRPLSFLDLATWDHLAFAPPSLHIIAATPITLTIGPTTDEDIILIANQDVRIQPTHVYRYDASGPTYTQLVGTALPWTLLPAAPAAGDILYIGMENAVFGVSDFVIPNLVFQLSTSASDLTITWEYSAPAGAWNALSVVDYTFALSSIGQNSVHFEQPSNWTAVAVNGVTTYWIRARITATGGAPVSPIQTTNPVWCARTPFVDIAADDIRCDAAPQFEMLTNPLAAISAITNNLSIDNVWIGRRATSRSVDFRSFLNLHTQSLLNPAGIVVTFPGGALVDDVLSPVGECFQYAPAGVVAETRVITVDFSGVASSDYVGTYRMFLRRRFVTNSQNMTWRAVVSDSATVTNTPLSVSTGYVTDTTSTDVCLLDMGVVTFPPSPNMIGNGAVAPYYLHILAASSAACTTNLFDVVLIPIDEWAINVWQPIDASVSAWTQGYAGTRVSINNLSASGEISAGFINTSNQTLAAMMNEKTGINAFIPKTDQRFYFLFGTYYTGYLNYQRRYKPECVASITMKLLKAFKGL